MKKSIPVAIILIIIFMLFSCSTQGKKEAEEFSSSQYEDLVKLFEEWRDFQKPKIEDGVPDYTKAAIEEQRIGLKSYQNRLAALDPNLWPISQQVDYHIVRAEMTGLDDEMKKLK